MHQQGRVLWITGLSGAGKSTLARALLPHLPGAVLLDGDELRTALDAQHTGYDTESRKRLALTYARLARQGITVVVATISLFHEVHAWNRENLPGYMEIFLDVPEGERRCRDPKGLYAAEHAGTVCQMAGTETPVERPLTPHLTLPPPDCTAHSFTVEDAVEEVLAAYHETATKTGAVTKERAVSTKKVL